MSWIALALASHVAAAAGFGATAVLILRWRGRATMGTPLGGFVIWWACLATVEALRAAQHALVLADLESLDARRVLILLRLLLVLAAGAGLASYVLGIFVGRFPGWRLLAGAYAPVAAWLAADLLTAPSGELDVDVAHGLVTGMPAPAAGVFLLTVLGPVAGLAVGYGSLRARLGREQRRRHAWMSLALLTWVAGFLAAYLGGVASAHALAVVSAAGACAAAITLGTGAAAGERGTLLSFVR